MSGYNLWSRRAWIREIVDRDMSEVLQIEKASFGELALTEEDFVRWSHRRNCYGMAAEIDKRIVGFYIYEDLKYSRYIIDFAVAPFCRRKSIGSQMVDDLVKKLPSRCNRITLHVRETNLGAQKFFAKKKFDATKVLREWYSDTHEDAFLMEYLNGVISVNRISQYLKK